MSVQERKEMAISALHLLVKICPPEEYGEDSDCEELFNSICEMGAVKPDDLIKSGLAYSH